MNFDDDGHGSDMLPDDGAPAYGEDDADRELMMICADEPETDIGNGRRFLHRYKDLALHVARVGWHAFDGRRWREDEDGTGVRPLAHRTAEAIFDEGKYLKPSPHEQAILDAASVAQEMLQTLEKPKKAPDPLAGGVDEHAAKVRQYADLEQTVQLGKDVMDAMRARHLGRYRFAKSTCGSAKINNMLIEAAPYCSVLVDALNTDLYAVNVLNGTLRFVREEDPESEPDDPRYVWSVTLDRHNRSDMISKLVEANWHNDAPAPKEWLKFLLRVQPSLEMRDYLQRLVGYSLLGLNTEQMIAFFFGIGRNGKSTFMDTLCKILGDYSVTLSIDSFTGETHRGGGEATPDLARLPGARLVAASEPESGVRLREGMIKTITGGERIPVRRLRQDFFDFAPQFTLIISGNHKPLIINDDDGIWRRLHLVPWDVQIPKAEVDKLLPVKLMAERDAILAWAVKGALDFLNQGGLNAPAAILDATQEYREDQDPIGAFIRGACDVTGDATNDAENPVNLFMAYERFATQNGIVKLKDTTFYRRLPDATKRAWAHADGTMRTFSKAKSDGATLYRGIQIKHEWRNTQSYGGSSDGQS